MICYIVSSFFPPGKKVKRILKKKSIKKDYILENGDMRNKNIVKMKASVLGKASLSAGVRVGV